MNKKRNVLLFAALLSFTLGACHFGSSSSTINSSSDSSSQESSIVSSIESSSSSSSSSLERKQLNPDEVLEYVDDPEYIGGLAVKAINRDINGDLHRELIGVYINFSLEIGIIDDFNKYNELWEKLTEKKEFHKIRISSNTHEFGLDKYNAYEFTAYLADIEDEGFLIRDDKNTFKGLKVEFIAKSPHKVEYNYHNRNS